MSMISFDLNTTTLGPNYPSIYLEIDKFIDNLNMIENIKLSLKQKKKNRMG